MPQHIVSYWLINTGWTGECFGLLAGRHCPFKFASAIVDAVHGGSLLKAECANFGVFNLNVPTYIPGVPRELLIASLPWSGKDSFSREVRKLAGMFVKASAVYWMSASVRAAALETR